MARCHDPLIVQLNSLGFNALRVPRTDYEPSKLLIRQGRALPSLFGTLTDGFSNISLPEITIGTAGQMVKGASARYQQGLGLKLASDWLRSPLAKLESVFASTRHISFRFGDTRLLSVPMATLSRTIADGKPTKTMLEVAEARLFVINEVLQVREFFMITEGDASQAISIQTLDLDSVGATVETSLDSSLANSGILVFKANQHHTIGFKAYEVEISGGGYRLAPFTTSGALSHLTEGDPVFEPVLFEEYSLF